MKKVLLSALLCGLLASSQTGYAQDTIHKVSVAKPNIVKINLTSLIFKNLSLQYERVVNKRMSVALGFSLMPKTGLPFASTLQEEFGDNADAKRAIETTQLSNYTITPEVRFYVGKKGAPTGFYLAPFARYQHMYFQQEYSFTASSGKVHRPLIGGNINNLGGGILLGAQWNISGKINFDWWITGPLIGNSSGNLSGIDDMSDMSAADKADLENDIESVDIPLTKLDATVGNNRVDVKVSGAYTGVRGLGFTLGFRF